VRNALSLAASFALAVIAFFVSCALLTVLFLFLWFAIETHGGLVLLHMHSKMDWGALEEGVLFVFVLASPLEAPTIIFGSVVAAIWVGGRVWGRFSTRLR
jgi:hypothetical protein